jgi:hypothetical protein
MSTATEELTRLVIETARSTTCNIKGFSDTGACNQNANSATAIEQIPAHQQCPSGKCKDSNNVSKLTTKEVFTVFSDKSAVSVVHQSAAWWTRTCARNLQCWLKRRPRTKYHLPTAMVGRINLMVQILRSLRLSRN